MNFRDAEFLSAYLDGQLSAADVPQLERRLAADAGLRQVLDDLRVARGLLRRVPRRKAPRNFMLSALDPRVRAPRPRAVPALAYAGALASLLFLLSVTANGLAPLAGRMFIAAPVLGVGGGMGGGEGGVVPEAPAPEESLAMGPAATPERAAPAAPSDTGSPTLEAFAKAAPPEQGIDGEGRRQAQALVPAVWVVLLALAAMLLGSLSWYLDRFTRRRFRSRFLEK